MPDSLSSGRKDTSNLGRLYDAWVLKLDSSGNLQWEKTFGSPGTDCGESAVIAIDGDYLLLELRTDLWLENGSHG